VARLGRAIFIFPAVFAEALSFLKPDSQNLK
jgi:hypothetical protein